MPNILSPYLLRTCNVPNIDFSALFFGSSDYLSRTPASSGDRRTWTFSGWVKRGKLGAEQLIFNSRGDANNQGYIGFASNDRFQFRNRIGSTTVWRETTQVFRDVGAWYHIHLIWDTTESTAGDRIRIYINGEEVTEFSTENNPSENFEGYFNQDIMHWIGSEGGTGGHYDGYLSELYFFDGIILDPNEFGRFINSVWMPKKYTGAFGDNGFKLDFSNPGDLGEDLSGNDNHWSKTGDVEQTNDSPTKNFATLLSTYEFNGTDSSRFEISRGNLRAGCNNNVGIPVSTQILPGHAVYCEIEQITVGSEASQINFFDPTRYGGQLRDLGIHEGGGLFMGPGRSYYQNFNGNVSIDGATETSYGDSWFSANDIISVAVSPTGKVWFAKNGTWQNGATLAEIEGDTGTSHAFSVADFGEVFLVLGLRGSGTVFDLNTGQQPFEYPVPSGYRPLNARELPRIPIKDPSKGFHQEVVIHSGSTPITLGWNPDPSQGGDDTLFIIKRIDSTGDWFWIDTVRGIDKYVRSNSSANEVTDADIVTNLTTSGFTLGSGVVNGDYLVMAFRANPAFGFEIKTRAGSGSNETLSHNLGQQPKQIFVKQLDGGSASWRAWRIGINSDQAFLLDGDQGALTEANTWNDTFPDADDYYIGTRDAVNDIGLEYIDYLWTDIPGFQLFTEYTGNGNADGPFAHAGFEPAFVSLKRKTGSSPDALWTVNIEALNPFNPAGGSSGDTMYFNVDTVTGSQAMDLVSSGIKQRGTGAAANTSSVEYTTWLIAKNPFGGRNCIPPGNAR